LEKVVISPLKTSNKYQNEDHLNELLENDSKCCTLEEFIAESDDRTPLNYFEAPFNHPLCILFSSGTTGEPKCLVHSVGVCLHFFT